MTGGTDALTADQINWLARAGLAEDLGAGDVTTDSIFAQPCAGEAVITAKEPLILCGVEIARAVFAQLDGNIVFTARFNDGGRVEKGGNIAQLRGDAAALLKGERTALNILQRLSGIATLTCAYVERARPAVILDTRKTTPGLRAFEKYAVRCGGGRNHRFGLYDAVLIKDNHIKAAGGIGAAVRRVRGRLGAAAFIEVETATLAEVDEALAARVNRIMLDNMGLDMIRAAITKINGQAETEVSGSVTLERTAELGATGVNYISAGAITHSAKAVDIAMNFL